jgi:hypothetical protein
MKFFFVLSLLFLGFLAYGQYPCLECDPIIPQSYDQIDKTPALPGPDIQNAAFEPQCPWGIQVAAYSTLVPADEQFIAVYQEGMYRYFLMQFYITKEEAFNALRDIQRRYPGQYDHAFVKQPKVGIMFKRKQ